MITASIYLIDSIIVGFFAYKCYSIGYGKGLKNSFANYLFLSSTFISIGFLKSGIMCAIATSMNNSEILFWSDFTGRALFYLAAVFSVQIPLYKFYPNDKRRFLFSIVAIVVGLALLAYQLFFRNHPIIEPSGMINWDADIILLAGMTYLIILPWVVTTYIFTKEYFASKLRSPKSLLLGLGFFCITVGGTLQDASSTILSFIIFGIVSAIGYLMVLAGLFYET